jgi:hemoglobin
MKLKSDIQSMKDIKVLVNSFYSKVRMDSLLGEIFNRVIQDRWPEHLQKMYTFWQTVLLDEHSYYGSPFPPHAKLPIQQDHFDRWLHIWHSTIDEHFEGQVADEAKWRGGKMASMFMLKIDYFRNNNNPSLV